MGEFQDMKHYRGNSFGGSQIVDVINIDDSPSKYDSSEDYVFQRKDLEERLAEIQKSHSAQLQLYEQING
jgi:hypothetical protein